MAKLRILGRVTSINVRKVLWLADELGLDYEREDWGQPLRDPHEPEFLRLNPNATVPVIDDEGFVLWESNAILSYLARWHGSPLLPQEPRAQAQVERWLYWQVSELNAQWGYAVFALMRKDPAYTDAARIAESVAKWTTRMEVLEGQLGRTGAFVCGDDFTIADIALGLSVHRWFMTPLAHPALPAVARYYERLQGREAGRSYLGTATP